MTEAASDSQSLAAQAVTLAKAGKPAEAAAVLVNLSREELAGAVAELARMAIARDARVFPQGQGDECQLAPNWPMCWGDWILAVVRAGDEEQFAKPTGPDAMPLADLCLRVLLAAAAGTEAEAAS
jgi:hypothetical protein